MEGIAHKIRCAEIWGGVSVKEEDVVTPGVRAAIHSAAGGGSKGGDLYYFSVCGYDALTRIAIADVRGHGEAVSHLSEWLYRSLADRMNDQDGAGVLNDLNGIVHTHGFEAITTAVVATLHRDKGELHYAYAGHPPLLHWRMQDSSWRPLEATNTAAATGPSNLPLGILDGVRYTQETVRVTPGDRLFLYTDGISECPGANDSLFGDQAMLDALADSSARALPEARDSIRKNLASYAGTSTHEHDDTTFLLVEVLPPVPFWKRRIFPATLRPR